MKKIEKHKEIRATVRESLNHYSYEFSPPLDPRLNNVPRRVTDIIQKELVPHGGGLALQSVQQKQNHSPHHYGGEGPMERNAPPVATILNIPKSTGRDTVERLFSLMRESGFDIEITTEKYASGSEKIDKVRKDFALKSRQF